MKYDEELNREFFMYSRNKVSLIIYNHISKYFRDTYKYCIENKMKSRKKKDLDGTKLKSHIKN